MKKMMILTAASALLCTFMTGCTINVSDDAVSTSAEKDAWQTLGIVFYS